MRNGIVQGEPGIFPWPVGRFFHWISRLGHPDHEAAPPPEGAATGPEAASEPGQSEPGQSEPGQSGPGRAEPGPPAGG
jgi:hypothetical protein